MKSNLILFLTTMCLTAILGCQSKLPQANEYKQEKPGIYPDYQDVTVPVNISPLNFGLTEEVEDAVVNVANSHTSFNVWLDNQTFQFPPSEWEDLLRNSAGASIRFTILTQKDNKWTAYQPFDIHISADSIDPYLVYRKIAPGYELWKKMGIYQRHLASFDESAVLENDQTDNNCMNCHSFCNRNPKHFLFHMRNQLAGTYFITGKDISKLNLDHSSLVYPSWHPGGRFVAFSMNLTKQFFHPNSRNRIEVYDEASDIVVYDLEKEKIISSPLLNSNQAFETFPAFSADGNTLYFCTAEACKMPDNYQRIKYNLCAIPFNPQESTFGEKVDTLYSVEKEGKSVSFPRVSPDGKYLLYTLSGYGNFSIWHKDADLYWIDLKTGLHRSIDEVNSPDVESYHSWSSNSRWFVFSSRREDGLYTRPYIAHVSSEGQVGKPFVLPQPLSSFYKNEMNSYNIPEFATGKISVSTRAVKSSAQSKGKHISISAQ